MLRNVVDEGNDEGKDDDNNEEDDNEEDEDEDEEDMQKAGLGEPGGEVGTSTPSPVDFSAAFQWSFAIAPTNGFLRRRRRSTLGRKGRAVANEIHCR